MKRRARRRMVRNTWKTIRVMLVITIIYVVGAGMYVGYQDFHRSLIPTPSEYTHTYQKSKEDCRIQFAAEVTKENKSLTVVTSGEENRVVTFITTKKNLEALSDTLLEESSVDHLSIVYGFREMRITCPDFKELAIVVNLETGKVERMSF